MSWVMYPSKNAILDLFLASKQANAWKVWANSVFHLSRPSHFCPHPDGGVGWQGKHRGWGKAAESTKQGKNPFMAKMQLFIVGLTDLWAVFTCNKRCIILYVFSKKCKLKLKLAFFWLIYNLFSEVICDFSWSLRSCSSASSGLILNFSKDLKSSV